MSNFASPPCHLPPRPSTSLRAQARIKDLQSEVESARAAGTAARLTESLRSPGTTARSTEPLRSLFIEELNVKVSQSMASTFVDFDLSEPAHLVAISKMAKYSLDEDDKAEAKEQLVMIRKKLPIRARVKFDTMLIKLEEEEKEEGKEKEKEKEKVRGGGGR